MRHSVRTSLAVLVICGGCSQSATLPSTPVVPNPPPAAAAAAPTAITPVKHVDTANLKLGDYLPPLDDGRIEIAPPAGWRPLPRDSNYLVRFYESDRNSLPRINVIVEANDANDLSDVTEANVGEFVVWVAKRLEAKGTSVVEPPVPMVIGDVPCARYVSNLKLSLSGKQIVAERESLQVLRKGRLYTIDLLVLPNTLERTRDASFDPAYAICSGLRFLEENTTEVPAEPE